ncbi:type II toxin-antitoxin system RelE/ParE family toxin [Sedimenticola hydrogenitrophicus]|uniref:type II toxin-antitoxin system RelE/ParE family toxin n=1 Tax=Sedimenticola hydrogenitrophicus TaxID=2967975 RepID=UPI0021A85DB3|nr:type II toxin-antitoxin system RelE/ParE family toxin [Sedimenticola hydrogenitrophicus]
MRYHIVSTDDFNHWLTRIRDRQAARAIAQRLDRAAAGNLGDVKPVGQGVSEMRIFAGPGYRLYFTIRDGELIILLCGGNKSSQSRDIARAQRILNELEA